MRFEQILILAVLACISVFMVIYYVRQEKPIRSALFGSLSGAATFVGAKLLFGLFGVTLQLNLFSLLLSLTLGIPGVAVLSVLQLIV